MNHQTSLTWFQRLLSIPANNILKYFPGFIFRVKPVKFAFYALISLVDTDKKVNS